MSFEFRFGQEADAPIVADFVAKAGDGLFESLLDGIVPGVGSREFVRMAVNTSDSPLHYANAVIAEEEGRIAGMALCYPSAEYGLHPVLRNLVPNRRLEPLKALFDSKVEDSLYLNSLYVAEHARNAGLGRLLVEFCLDLAVEQGLSALSLHAWADNDAALRIYFALRFEEVEKVPVSLRNKPERTCGMVLLKALAPSPQ